MNVRKPAVVAGAAVVTLSALFGGWQFVPRERPAVATAARYSAAMPADEAPALVPPSVLEGVVPPTPAPSAFQTLAAPVERISIPAIDVSSSIVAMNLTPAGALDSPESADLVAWYDFTGKPGTGGNAVMSGHLDYVGVGPAVFWDLEKLQPGDAIEVWLRDGTSVQYRVAGAQSYPTADVPMAEVLAPTEHETLTLITCDGSFSGGHYSHRLVMRAFRVES